MSCISGCLQEPFVCGELHSSRVLFYQIIILRISLSMVDDGDGSNVVGKRLWGE